MIHQLGATLLNIPRPRVDAMTKTRHDVAVQKVGPGPDHMPIGEFGGAAALPGDGSPLLSAPMYWLYEMGHAALTPARAFADAGRIFLKNPANPFSTRHPLPATRTWPRALVPGMPASGAFTVDYGGTATPSPGFYPFEPARLQPQPTEPLPEAP